MMLLNSVKYVFKERIMFSYNICYNFQMILQLQQIVFDAKIKG